MKYTHLVLLTLVLTLSACSMFGKGKKGAGDGSLSESDLDAIREERYGSGSIPTAEGGSVFRDISFDYDSSNISDMARQDIEYNAEILRSNPDVKIQLEGHCDERGTAEYNLALGARRARAVEEALLSLGVPGTKLGTISYGEEVPLNSGHGEDAWAENRRVHFSGYQGMPNS